MPSRGPRPTLGNYGAANALFSGGVDKFTEATDRYAGRVQDTAVSQLLGNYVPDTNNLVGSQQGLMSQLAGTGVDPRTALGLVSAATQPYVAQRDYARDVMNQDRTYNLGVDKLGETIRSNRADEYKIFEGADGGQYGIDTGNRDYLVQKESGNSYTAKNPNTSAYGKYQQTDQIRNAAVNRGWVSSVDEAMTPQGQDRIQDNMDKENASFLNSWNVPINRDTNLTIHQLGANDARSFFSGTATPDQLQLWKTNAPIQYKAYTSGGYGSPKVDQLTPGVQQATLVGTDGRTYNASDVVLKSETSRDPVTQAEVTTQVPYSKTGVRLSRKEPGVKYKQVTQKDADKVDGLITSVRLADEGLEGFNNAIVGKGDTFTAWLDNATGLNMSEDTAENITMSGRWNILGGQLVKSMYGGNASDADRRSVFQFVPQVSDSETVWKAKAKEFVKLLRDQYGDMKARMDKTNPGYMEDLAEQSVIPVEEGANLGTPEGRATIREDIVEDPVGTLTGVVAGSPFGMLGDVAQATIYSPEELSDVPAASSIGNSTGRLIGSAATGGAMGGTLGNRLGLNQSKQITDRIVDSKLKSPAKGGTRAVEETLHKLAQAPKPPFMTLITDVIGKVSPDARNSLNSMYAKLISPISGKAKNTVANNIVSEALRLNPDLDMAGLLTILKDVVETGAKTGARTGTAAGALLGGTASDPGLTDNGDGTFTTPDGQVVRRTQ